MPNVSVSLSPPTQHHSFFNLILIHLFYELKWYALFTSFQMTVENNYAIIAIDTLKDWLKNLVPVFQPLRRKTKTNRNL